MRSEAEFDEQNESMLAAIWQRHRPVVIERICLLDRAAAAAMEGTLNVEMREEAAGTAHKLAGSLGMYGYDEGTRLAQEIEVMLLEDSVAEPMRLWELAVELRRAVFPVM
jgi:HPt (histidine-containing phosphotransfer) domain-containing protein